MEHDFITETISKTFNLFTETTFIRLVLDYCGLVVSLYTDEGRNLETKRK